MNVAANETTVLAKFLVVALFRDRFGSYEDYYSALEETHGWPARRRCEEATQAAVEEARFASLVTPDLDEVAARALLVTMPEDDFMLAIEDTLSALNAAEAAAPRITKVCETRGIPYRFVASKGFEWIGDTIIESELIAPAQAAINDSRFAGGVRDEFEHARAELRHGTANGRKQAVHEAGCAVESAMKVVLDHQKLSYAKQDAGQALFNHLESARLVERFMEPLVFAVLTPRNKTAGHGGGAEALDPGEAEAASVVAAAAGVIAYLHSKLP